MPSPTVSVFFYGSYMSHDVLRGVDLDAGKLEPARQAEARARYSEGSICQVPSTTSDWST
jgi:hypothetical protein